MDGSVNRSSNPPLYDLPEPGRVHCLCIPSFSADQTKLTKPQTLGGL